MLYSVGAKMKNALAPHDLVFDFKTVKENLDDKLRVLVGMYGASWDCRQGVARLCYAL